jgi:hypothetical protein
MSTATLHINGTSATTYAWNGSVWGTFSHNSWTIYAGMAKGGEATGCASERFVARGGTQSYVTVSLGAFQYVNDSGEPDDLVLNESMQNASAIGPITFENGFYRETEIISTCGTGPKSYALSSTSFQIVVPFTADGVAQNVTTSIQANITYEYAFPPNVGTWAIDNLSAPGGPGGGWAFSYLGAC